MSIPQRKINNFMSRTSKEKVDSISRKFIFMQVPCGLFRLPILGIASKIQLSIMFGIKVLYNCAIIYNLYFAVAFYSYGIAPICDTVEFVSCTLLGFVTYKELLKFYAKINRIDKDLQFCHNSQPKKEVFVHFVQILIIGITVTLNFWLVPECLDIFRTMPFLIPLKILHYLELNYYGHLFALLIPRLKLLTNKKKKSCYIKEDQKEKYHYRNDKLLIRYDIGFLMDSYNRLLKAYDYLNKAIRWQLLIIIIAMFNVSLSLAYYVSKLHLEKDKKKVKGCDLCINITFLVIEVVPFVIPCLLASQVSGEVVNLEEAITSRVHENKLDTSYQCTAVLFLELLRKQPLSFPLLHLFVIDLTLPFKLLSLILTYLIILLQFDRVININKII
ncbi:uncharacterized protein LOC133319299 [Danaus plexippus]|uniref:uncharacterized protein LOC133319299 n=1 Tax=Danaus plexippus TaxID=13037 RepID=UPI002AAFE17B|nr:uncharacterized protein LOC133319299 [Danaus plexippus]